MYIDSYKEYTNYCLYRKAYEVPSTRSCLLGYFQKQNKLDIYSNIWNALYKITISILYKTSIKLFTDEPQI